MKTLLQSLIGCTVFTLTVLTQIAFAQVGNPIKFEHLNVEDGLPHNVTQSVVQDDQGFMWFATKNGLAKYDGAEFTVYKHESDNPNSLGNNYVWSILKDHNGILWASTLGGGVNKFDPVSETFTRYQQDENNPNSLISNIALSICEDKTGILWIATDSGFSRFDPNDESFVNYQHDENDPNSLSDNYIYSIYQDDNGILWIGTFGGGLNKFDPKTETFSHYLHDENNLNSLVNDSIWQVYGDNEGMLWIATAGGLDHYDSNSNTFTHYQHEKNNPNSLSLDSLLSIYKDSRGILWIGTEGGGLNQFDRINNRFTRYQNEPNNPNSLSNNLILGINEDINGALWIMTENGLNKYDPGNDRFAHYYHHPLKQNGLNNNQISAIYEDKKGILWIGTKGGGLNKFDQQNDTFIHYQHDDNNPHSISNNNITAIHPDSTGTLWIAMEAGGLNRFDPFTKTFVHYPTAPNDPNKLSNSLIWDIDVDLTGNVWIAYIGAGLYQFNPTDKTVVHYQSNENNPNGLMTNWLSVVKVVSNGMIWIGTDEMGASQFDPVNKTFTHYLPLEKEPHSLSNGVVNTVFEDSKGTIWIGTNGGLNRFNHSNHTFTIYKEKQGLAGNSVAGILEDNQGSLWISTNKGLSKFNPQTETFRNYDKHDGLQGNLFLPRSAYKSATGEIFFGGINGFNAFYPNKLVDNPYIPPVFLTDFQLFNKSVSVGKESPLQKHINLAEQITLSYEQSVFSFEFVALNYRASAKNQYAYMMEGFDKDWTYVNSNRRFATYTNLDAGEYTFRVKASNNDGLWNEKGTSIIVLILPPWWQTWWAYTLYTLAILGSIIGIFFIQQRKLAYTRVLVKIKELQVETVRLEVVEEKNKMMMESIQYAKIIQSSLLPNLVQVKTYLPKSFFLWMPRDVVGGDMLYAESVVDGFIIAVIDCTGHGVPGAFMTMISSTNLTRIIREETCHDPAEILKRLNFSVKTSLQQDTEHAQSDDGLDAAICLVKPHEKRLTFAGAKLPLYYIHNDKLTVIKGDKKSLGYKKSDLNFTFTNHTVNIEGGMSCYLSSDGFLEQRGGPKRLIFATKRFKKLLLENYHDNFDEQEKRLLQAFNEYKGDNDRQDDVTVVGFGF